MSLLGELIWHNIDLDRDIERVSRLDSPQYAIDDQEQNPSRSSSPDVDGGGDGQRMDINVNTKKNY